MPKPPEPGEGYRADFFSGVQPLCQFLNSATVSLAAADSAPAVSDQDHLRALEEWLTAYNAWYVSAGGAGWPPGLRFRLLYYRDLSATASLAQADALCRLAALGLKLGMGFSYVFDAAEFAENEDAARRVATQPGLAIALIRVGSTTPLAVAGRLKDFVLSLIERRAHISFTARMDRLKALRLLDDPVIAGSVLRIIPYGDTPSGEAPSNNPPLPCARYFRLNIARSGEVFPCAGLVDVPGASLGSVYEPFADSVLAGRAWGLDLAALCRNGPALDSAPLVQSPDQQDAGAARLPAQCRRHRAQLLRQS